MPSNSMRIEQEIATTISNYLDYIPWIPDGPQIWDLNVVAGGSAYQIAYAIS